MLRRSDLQVLIAGRNIWPVALSLTMHAFFLVLVSMPRAPKLPDFLVVEMTPSVPFSAPAKAAGTVSAAPQRKETAAVQPEPAKAAPVEKAVMPTQPVRQAAQQSVVATQPAAVPAQSGSTKAATAVSSARVGAPSTKAGPPIAAGPVEGTFGASDGPGFIHAVPPVYPRIARKLGKEGTVLLRIALDESGRLVSVSVVEKGGHGFDEAALAAVKASRFRAARQRGVAVPCRALLPIRFKLED